MLKIFMKSTKGFTLVELMVVVVILGILTSIAIPVYKNTQDNAREKACYANQRIIEGAAQQYIANEDGDTHGAVDECDSSAAVFTLLQDYLKAKPQCPSGGEYHLTTDGTVSCVGAEPNVHGYYGDAIAPSGS